MAKDKITRFFAKDHPYLSMDLIPEDNPIQESPGMIEQGNLQDRKPVA